MLASSVQVALMSRRSAEFRANLERPLKYVKREAQTAFQIEHGFLLLRNSEGQERHELQTLGESGWRPGDVLTLQVLPQTKVASGSSFVAIMSDGARVARGRRNIVCVGNVQHVQATEGAFAAVMDNGTIDTWGDPSCGADSISVQEQLVSVQQLQATERAFAAIRTDGTVVNWGHAACGGGQPCCSGAAYKCSVYTSLAECCSGQRQGSHLGRSTFRC